MANLEQLFEPPDGLENGVQRATYGAAEGSSATTYLNYTPRTFEGSNASGLEVKVCATSTSSWRGAASGVTAGLMALGLTVVQILSFSTYICQSQRVRPHMSSIIGMVCLGTLVISFCSLTSKIPLYVVCPDLFVCPFVASGIRYLEAAIPPGGDGTGDEIFCSTVIVMCLMMVFTLGVFLALSSQLKLLRLGDFTPFPVVQGIVASVGVGLIRSAFRLEFEGRDINAQDSLWLVGAAVTATLLFTLEYSKLPRAAIYLPILIAATVLFYLALWASSTSIEEGIAHADAKDAFFKPEDFDNTAWFPGKLYSAILSGRVDWGAIRSASGPIAAYVIFELLRVSLLMPSLFKGCGVHLSETEKSAEFRLLGIGHIISALVGSFGSIPFLSTQAMLRKTFRTTIPWAANMIVCAGLTFLLLFSFAAVRVVPRFIVSAILMHRAATTLRDSFVLPMRQVAPSDGAVSSSSPGFRQFDQC